METTFYDDVGKQTMKNMRKNMTLDFNNPQRPSKRQKVSQHNTTLLSSPDLNMLKLASPELEKLIIQQNNGVVTTTPTPTQFIFPKNVTEEQELYARGFVDALAELHNSDSGLSESGASATNGVTSFASPFFPVNIKEEPQTVPSLNGSPPMSPINMESQEKIKLERKRQRNRIAASKCRKRKLERISRLEDKVRILKGENSELGNVVIQTDGVCVICLLFITKITSSDLNDMHRRTALRTINALISRHEYPMSDLCLTLLSPGSGRSVHDFVVERDAQYYNTFSFVNNGMHIFGLQSNDFSTQLD
uniref:BZIP domain-containing protein n=1 Tax=Strigamia maritima TaxID=126957 RepID=T1ITD4_STRMM